MTIYFLPAPKLQKFDARKKYHIFICESNKINQLPIIRQTSQVNLKYFLLIFMLIMISFTKYHEREKIPMIKPETKQDESEKDTSEEEFTPWHDYFSGMFKESLIPLNLDVEAHYAIGKGPPKVDVLIIRKESDHWTKEQLQYLPDGVRHSKCPHIILELKKTQSISKRSVWQSMGYFNQYLNLKKLSEKDVQIFLISAKTPWKETLKKLDFIKTPLEGVYKSKNKLTKNLKLLCANDLPESPHNMWIKFFASKRKQKSIALNLLFSTNYHLLNKELKILLFNIITYWDQTGEYVMEKIKKDLSPKSYLNPNPAMFDLIKFLFPSSEIVNIYEPEELLKDIRPEERLKGLRPEERLKGLRPEERLEGLKPEEIFQAYPNKIEFISGLKPEERLSGLDRKTIEEYLKLLKS